jgi:hypothetical protein
MNPDFEEFLLALSDAGVRFLVVGAHALAIHGVVRATGDIDIWIERSRENAERVWNALESFGAPVEALGISRADLEMPDVVIQLGVPPRRIDLLTGVSGLTFEGAWADRVLFESGSITVPFLSRAQLLLNKRSTGRLKDLADLEALGDDTTSR